MAFEDPKFPVTDPAPGMGTVFGNLNATDVATIVVATAGSAAWCFKGGEVRLFLIAKTFSIVHAAVHVRNVLWPAPPAAAESYFRRGNLHRVQRAVQARSTAFSA